MALADFSQRTLTALSNGQRLPLKRTYLTLWPWKTAIDIDRAPVRRRQPLEMIQRTALRAHPRIVRLVTADGAADLGHP
ncbi:MAG TPA: hypothetical protein VEJ84_05465, partial [Acidimicrobiales bacterium]|nr:hypothetical protein [Acidimicrobiales bacterium]